MYWLIRSTVAGAASTGTREFQTATAVTATAHNPTITVTTVPSFMAFLSLLKSNCETEMAASLQDTKIDVFKKHL
jgi:hypothetical protein